ncbi:hypothetical protein [Streptomyces sp. VRA16 Mangrove soil]|uniref:hypothetical protein n=1 Tax=Streptomyces sp. VRA16 Mangrove soil TaxID=2817434 RepID=UPI001A9EC8CD|nr:hypothetical protein [Streptomyces sp. VRA16 Mangrove soil]MBO1330216.1 hypothetical protein [Streptomyces sp. VRA16 Mangrove soil]
MTGCRPTTRRAGTGRERELGDHVVETAPRERAELQRAFPELAPYGLPAARLHPRPGTPTVRDSSVGGPPLWPADEPWPTCAGPHPEPMDLGPRAEDASHAALHQVIAALGARPVPGAAPVPLVPVLQLRRSDAPGTYFPGDADLLQILWCPRQHAEASDGLRPAVFWRRAAEVTPGPARPTAEPGPRVPVPCAVHPEELVEFPWMEQGYGYTVGPSPLPGALQRRIHAWDADRARGLDYHALAVAPGWKVGGWDLTHPVCDCGTTMVMLFQTSQYEFLDGTWAPRDDPGFPWGDPGDAAAQQPTGVRLGGDRCAMVHLCPADPDHPLHHSVN